MSSPTETPAAPSPPPSWPVLSLHERRVLGVLVEKSKTTPDVYPMSINALVTGSNQKNNRDPILNLSEVDVEEALGSAKQKGLVLKVIGGRVERWRQQLYEAWKVDKNELAVLAELLLRGPQTEGELRTRVSRMAEIDDLDALRVLLKPLAERKLVIYLTPEGRRGTMVTHGFHAPEDLERLRARHGVEEEAEPVAARAVSTPLVEARLTEAQAEIAALRQQVTELQATVAGLDEQVKAIKQALGI